MSKKTAVEWLMEQITYKTDDGEIRNAFTDTVDLSEYFNQAKEMEKEQIIKAYKDGRSDLASNFHKSLNMSLEQYYNETFKNETK